MKKIRVGVVFGGKSCEHDVSIISAANVYENLEKAGFYCLPIGITSEGIWKYLPPSQRKTNENVKKFFNRILSKGMKLSVKFDSRKGKFLNLNDLSMIKVDVLFPVLHGSYGEDGTIQGFFEVLNIPYVGCGVFSSSAGMDKDMAKKIFAYEKIPVVKWLAFYDFEKFEDIAGKVKREIKFPAFVKPAQLGSSVGVSKVFGVSELEKAVKLAFKYDSKIIVEKAISAREIECSVLGEKRRIFVSEPGEIIPRGDAFYSYKAKYEDTGSELIIPANLNKRVINRIKFYAEKAFNSLDCEGMARVDFFVDKKNGKIFLNEVNTIPGFTAISMYPKLLEYSGVSYKSFLKKLINLAIKRHRKRNKKRFSC